MNNTNTAIFPHEKKLYFFFPSWDFLAEAITFPYQEELLIPALKL